MPGSILGNAVRRVEDPDLLTGRGTFIDNLRIDGMLRVAFVRSPIAHGRIVSVDTRETDGMPSVVAVYTTADPTIAPTPPSAMVLERACVVRPLAQGKGRRVGDGLAAVS